MRADKTNNFRFSQLKEGDKVLIKNITSLRKHDPVFHVKPFTITHLQGNQVHVRADDGQTFVRPLSYVKKFVQTVKKPCPKIDLAGFRQNVFKLGVSEVCLWVCAESWGRKGFGWVLALCS